MEPKPALTDDTDPIERIDGVAVLRLAGRERSTKAVVDRVSIALARAADAGLDRCILDVTGLTGFPAPTLSERHAMVRDWAAAVRGRMIVAMVCSPELIDPERFGVVAAMNFGLRSNVFADLDEAIAWLREA